MKKGKCKKIKKKSKGNHSIINNQLQNQFEQFRYSDQNFSLELGQLFIFQIQIAQKICKSQFQVSQEDEVQEKKDVSYDYQILRELLGMNRLGVPRDI
ncbi:unnamed protein product [Paramecium octaurelia]|uniref:Uncharacterized protein n=1 Tax=Paramecium octaurelia TaxID=43137 RepID=A0A8S1TQR8_PAROT|nr:unnamed protein product [Paramecium octaurelia]